MNTRPIAILAVAALVFGNHGSVRADAPLNGTWSILTNAGQTQLEMHWTSGHGSSSSTLRPIDTNALGITSALASSGQHVRFALHREAGDFALDGWVGNAQGGGTDTFVPNSAFFSDLASRGYKVDRPEDELAAADVDITREYVDEIRHLGISTTFNNLITFRALGVDSAYIQELESVGFGHLDADQIVTMRALHIDRAYVKGLQAEGVSDLDASNVVSLKALRVDGNYMADLASNGYAHLAAHDYVTLKALHVDGDYIKKLASHGFTHLTIEQLVNYKALHIVE
jgi:hypothetical protein